MHLKVRILRVLLYVLPNRRTDNVDLKVVLSCPLESILCKSRCETQMPQLFRNFRVNQLQDVSRQTVFQIGNLLGLLGFRGSEQPPLRRQLCGWRVAVGFSSEFSVEGRRGSSSSIVIPGLVSGGRKIACPGS